MTGFQPICAPDLVACIREGRHPTVEELCRVADRIGRDIHGHRSAFAWQSDANPAIDKAFAFRVAQAALTGNGEIANSAPPMVKGETSLQS